MVLRLSEEESLTYLKDRGYDISRSELYRLKSEIRDNTQQRLNLVASEEFLANHLQCIDTLKTIETQLWENYKNESNPSKKASILMQIADLQNYKTAFFDSTRYVLEQGVKLKKRKQQAAIA